MGFFVAIRSLIMSVYDKRTSIHLKILLAAIVIYLISPFDLISDILPLLGLIDDGAIGISGFAILRKFIDQEVYQEYKDKYQENQNYVTYFLLVGFILFWGILTLIAIILF